MHINCTSQLGLSHKATLSFGSQSKVYSTSANETSSWQCYPPSLYQLPTSRGQSNYLLVTFGVFVANEAGDQTVLLKSIITLGQFQHNAVPLQDSIALAQQVPGLLSACKKRSDGQCCWLLSLSLFQSGRCCMCFLSMHLL